MLHLIYFYWFNDKGRLDLPLSSVSKYIFIFKGKIVACSLEVVFFVTWLIYASLAWAAERYDHGHPASSQGK